jgi:DNA-binding MarR family transcriptional regulator
MPLTPDDVATWAALATVLERLPTALDAQLQRDAGLTHFEYGLLFALDTAPDRRLRLKTLAGYASCTLSRLSRAITRLEKDGLVTRVVDPGDGRITLGILTDAGHDRVRAAAPGHEELLRRVVFDVLTDRQAQELRRSSRLIAEAVGPEPIWTPPVT